MTRRQLLTQGLRPEQKQLCFEQGRALVRKRFSENPDYAGLCLYWAIAAYATVKEAGYTPILQAGNMSWPIITPNMDDGKRSTHFGYIWSPDRIETKVSIFHGDLPEMHVWIAIRETGELVDYSTGDLKRVARMHGYQWHVPDPPSYLWTKYLSTNVVYEPLEEPTFYAMDLIKRLHDMVRLNA